MVWCCGHVPAAAGSSDPNRVGEYVVRLNLTCNGTAASSVSSDGITATSKDAFSGSVNSEIHYEVIRINAETFASGDEISGSSSVSVSGGGSASIKSKDGSFSASWTYLPDPYFDPTIALACGTMESGSDPDITPNAWACRGDDPNSQIKITPETANPSTQGRGAAADAVAKLEGFDFTIPTNKVGWTRSGTHSAQVSYPTLGGSIQGSASVSVTVEFIPDQNSPWEAIIEGVPGAKPAYEDWIPLGGPDDADENPGSMFPVHVYIRAKDGSDKIPPLAKYSFFLKDVSREPGINMNFPHRSVPAYLDDVEIPFDLRIQPGDGMTPGEVGQLTETDDMVVGAAVGINSYDYGAYGKLRVIAQTSDGYTLVAHPKDQPDVDFLTLPKDDNLNHVADAWEKATNVFDQSYAADWDETSTPAKQRTNGDGISLYEKYRGFSFHRVYQRLNPSLKYVFVYDPSGMVGMTIGADGSDFQKASGCKVIIVSSKEWTGQGDFDHYNRIVNFNCLRENHAIDQHALHFEMNYEDHPGNPVEWTRLFREKYGEAPDPIGDTVNGCNFPDVTVAGDPWTPKNSIRAEAYPAHIINNINQTAAYHTMGLAKFSTYSSLSGDAQRRMGQDIWKNNDDYIAANHDQWLRRVQLGISRTIAHELGHGIGVDDLSNHQVHPTNCLMRYFGSSDFARNPDDRFELKARVPWPNIFCGKAEGTKKGVACWAQLGVTDRLPSSGAALMAAITMNSANSSVATRAVSGGATTYFASGTEQTAAPFELSQELRWTNVWAGDPLRLRLRLDCAQFQQAWTLAAIEATTNISPSSTLPWISTNWHEGLSLSLYRLETNGVRTPILSGNGWTNYLRPVLVQPEDLGLRSWSSSREWLVTPEAAGLKEGTYVVTAQWQGAGLTDPPTAPSDGPVMAADLTFQVVKPLDNEDKADYLHHMAFWQFLNGLNGAALTNALEALRLQPGVVNPETHELTMIAATAALRLNDLLSAAKTLDAQELLMEASPTSEVGDWIKHTLKALKPELRVAKLSPLTITVIGHTNQNYQVFSSPDLKTWTSVQTIKMTDNQTNIVDPEGVLATPKFYRITWLKP